MTEHPTFQAPDRATLEQLLPAYLVEKVLSTNERGAVYRARQKMLDRLVTIKLLSPALGADAVFHAGFQASSKAMARLNHPNLTSVFDTGEIKGMPFIVTEFVAGQSLEAAMAATGRFEPVVTAKLVIEICEGLAHAHENGVLHRDLRPANILLTQKGEPRIGNFGIGRPSEADYGAPEALDDASLASKTSDIYSAGAILFELLTGRLLKDERRPASEVCGCDARFDSVIEKATHPVSALRYQNAAEMARELAVFIPKPVIELARPQPVPTPLATAVPSPVPGTARSAARRVGPGGPRVGPQYAPARQVKKGGNGMLVVVVILLAAAGGIFFLNKGTGDAATGTTATTSDEPTKKAKPETSKNTVPTGFEKIAETTEANSGPEYEDTAFGRRLVKKDGAGSEPTGVSTPEMRAEERHEPATAQKSETSNHSKTAPKFDVPAFLARGRSAIAQRGAPVLTQWDAAVAKNIDDFERSTGREVRKLDSYSRESRRRVEDQVRDGFKTLRDDSQRLPDSIKDTKLDNVSHIAHEMEILFTKATGDQERIDKDHTAKLKDLESAYIMGLQKQSEQLRQADDAGAADLLDHEVDAIRADSERIVRIVRQQDPDAKPVKKKKNRDSDSDSVTERDA